MSEPYRTEPHRDDRVRASALPCKLKGILCSGNLEHEFKPSNYNENCVAYTGTHDNATFIEFISEMNVEQKILFYTDLKSECEKFNVDFKWNPNCTDSEKTMQKARETVIKIAYLSRAKYVIFPLQDILGIGAEARMNQPGTLGTQNWSWKYKRDALTDKLARKLRNMVKLSET